MADINIQMHKKNADGTYDNIFPVSNASFISTTDGSNVQTKLDTVSTALNLKADKANPVFTGSVTAPTFVGTATNTTSIAGALTVSTAEPSTVLPVGTLGAVV